MECRDRYFMIAVDLSAVAEPHFEAVGKLQHKWKHNFTGVDTCWVTVICVLDETGVYPITEQYAAECGYSITVCPVRNQMELRASYFSCHTHDKVCTNGIKQGLFIHTS